MQKEFLSVGLGLRLEPVSS